MVRQFADLALVEEVLTPTWYDGHHSAPVRSTRLVENVLAAMTDRGGTKFGIESGRLPAGITEGIRKSQPTASFFFIDPIIHRMKRQKDGDEIELIRQSIGAIEAGFQAARKEIHAGIRTRRIPNDRPSLGRSSRRPDDGIYGDFNSGPNTLRGGFPTLRRIQAGDLYLLDYSVVVFGYRGDFANTWVIDGRANDQFRRMHDASCEALAAGEALLQPGTPCSDIDAAVRASFARRGVDVISPLTRDMELDSVILIHLISFLKVTIF